MTTYDNRNRGVLFKNDKKEQENHPDYTGEINVEGTEKRLAAWIRETKDGSRKFMSIAVSDKQQQQGGGAQSEGSSEQFDDVPF